MRWWAVAGYSISIAAHVGLYAEVSSIPKDRPRRPTTVKVFETKKKEKKKEEEKKEDKPPPPPPKKVEAPKEPKNTPPPPTNVTPTPAGHEAMAALPDFGIALSGGSEGGIAVPMGPVAANAAGPNTAGAAPTEKKVRGPAPKPTDATDSCVEEPTKPKPTDKTIPQYVGSAAQSAGIEGVLKVEFTIDASGEVVEVKVISGSNPKLDELALPAAKRWKFSPATKCGKPVPSKYISTMRFTLGE